MQGAIVDGGDGGRGQLASVSDARFLALLDTLPYPAFLIPADGEGVHYNAAFVAYVGLRPGPTRADRTALNHPDDRAVLEAARDAGVAAAADYVVEVRLRRHDGAYRWHRIHNKPLFQGDLRTAYLGTAIDVHDARAATAVLERAVGDRTAALQAANARLAEERALYRELYNRTPMALHSSDANARLIEVNDTWLDLFGHRREAVIGRSPADFMTPDSAETYRARAWPAMLESGGAVRVVDYQFMTAAGRVFDGRLAGRGVFDSAGRLVRTWAAIADVTAEKAADRTLRQAQRMDAIGQLTAGIAHDFNNLLTAILGNLELASRPAATGGPPDEDRRRRFIAGARTAAERGAKLTAQLLAFSRQQRLVAGPLDVNALVDEMRTLLAVTIGDETVLDMALHPGLPNALGDATQLELAILNLVINARDAMADSPGAGGRIAIATGMETVGRPRLPEEPSAGDYVAIAVTDTGPGIPPMVRERMFEPFFTTKGAARGSGLGLAQVLGIAKQVGGGLRVRSVPGEGTTICLMLPLAGADLPPQPAEAQAVPVALGPLRILLVDDDADVRSATAALLAESGHAVTEAESAAAALNGLGAPAPGFDLVLADVVMPGMDGPGLAAEIGRRMPGLPVLFITGYADAAALPPALWDRVLAKPFRSADLEAWIATRSLTAGQ